MAQESKKVSVKRVCSPGTVEVDLLPWATAGDILHKIGASPAMVLSPDPGLGIVFDEGEELWGKVQPGQTVFVLPAKGPC